MWVSVHISVYVSGGREEGRERDREEKRERLFVSECHFKTKYKLLKQTSAYLCISGVVCR